MHHPLLRARHSQHLPLPLDHSLQRNMPVSLPLPPPSNHQTVNSLHTHISPPNSICSFILIFVEIPLLLRICPTSPAFDAFIRRFETNYMRAAIYLVMSIIQWLSLIAYATSLIAAAVFLLIAACFYALAGVKGQGFVGSKTLGGQGVAQMIV